MTALGDPAVAVPLERTTPAGTTRGTVLVLPGRGDATSHYSRLAARLAADGYAVEIAPAEISSVTDVVAAWSAGESGGVRVAIGVDSSAGFLAAALADDLLEPAPSGAVFAGAAVPGTEPDAGGRHAVDELAERSACPVHRGVVEASGAAPLSASLVRPVWPAGRSGVPVLALHGGADPISPLEATAPLHAGWNGERVIVAGGLHDVLNDVHHRSVAAEIVVFLERVRADAAGSPILRKEPLR
jgi:pimeloyl-ACP methyl ester carboxylesterase